MTKKVLFVLGAILLGVLLLSNAAYYTFFSIFQDEIIDNVRAEKYEEAERFFSSVIDSNTKYYENTFEDGTHIEVFPVLNDRLIKFTEEEKEYQYYGLELSYQFAIFNVKESFDFPTTNSTAEDLKVGGVILVMDDAFGSEIFFPFVGDTNFYDTYTTYTYIPFFIYESEFDKAIEDAKVFTDKIRTVKIVDNKNEVEYEFALQTQFTEVTGLLADGEMLDLATNYNEAQKSFAIDNTKEDKRAEMLKNLNSYATNKGYVIQPSVKIVTGSPKFIILMIVYVVIYLAIAGVIGYFIFRDKPFLGVKTTKADATVANQEETHINKDEIVDISENDIEEKVEE